jgi:hypothetical protein
MRIIIYLLLVVFIVTSCEKIPTDVIDSVSVTVIDTLASNWHELGALPGWEVFPQQDGWYIIDWATQRGKIKFQEGRYNSISISLHIKTELSSCKYEGFVAHVNGDEFRGVAFNDVVDKKKTILLNKTFHFDSLYDKSEPLSIIGDPVSPDFINYFEFLIFTDEHPGIILVKDILVTAVCK